MLVILYLGAIVLANLAVARFGPAVAPLNALVLIGLDLTTRDALHERWRGRLLWLRLLALIAAGGALSWLLNRDAGQIALASTVAFCAAALADAAVYAALGERARWQRVNGSNVVSAAVDSVLFPALAFGSVLPGLTLGLFVAKVFGGWLWSLVLVKRDLPLGRRAA